MHDITLEHGETIQIRLPGGQFLTVYSAPSGFYPLVQVTLPLTSNDYRLLVEKREAAEHQMECGFIRMFER